MDLVALLPWWAGLLLALVSYWLLSSFAARPLPAVHDVQQIGEMAMTAFWRGLAIAGQYLLPMICIAGACASAIRRRQRRVLLDNVSASTCADALHGISWQEFELLVGEAFRRRGYTVREIGGGGADGGVDLVLIKAGEKHFVQCKQWKAFKVGVSTVRELYGVMAAAGAAGGFVVTSGRFTQEATAFASGRNIRLMDGKALMQLLKDVRASAAAHPSPIQASATGARRSAVAENISAASDGVEAAAPVTPSDPTCPRCGQPMVRRVAKRGTGAGTAFWGCSDYSKGCRGTRDIQAA